MRNVPLQMCVMYHCDAIRWYVALFRDGTLAVMLQCTIVMYDYGFCDRTLRCTVAHFAPMVHYDVRLVYCNGTLRYAAMVHCDTTVMYHCECTIGNVRDGTYACIFLVCAMVHSNAPSRVP